MRRQTEHTVRVRQAFSLIEILIAVLILALGLLGLGALFPVVVREQRLGTDAIQGVLLTDSARALLHSTEWDRSLPTGVTGDVWASLRDSNFQGAIPDYDGLNTTRHDHGEWVVPAIDETSNFGAMQLGDPNPGVNPAVRVPVALFTRLYPTSADGVLPQYVWDIAAQRVPGPNSIAPNQEDTLRVAVFVRRIDPSIRVTPPDTLFTALLNPSVPANRRFPVGIDSQKMPTLDGTNGAGGLSYSRPIIVRRTVDFNDADPANPQYLIVRFVNSWPGAVMAVPGQKLVDNLGNVYTVSKVDLDPAGPGTKRRRLLLDPPIPVSAIDTLPPALREFVLTPQVPAGVALLEVKP